MLLHFTKKSLNFGVAEKLYWRYYLALFLLIFAVLLPSYGAVEALILTWIAVDVPGFAVILLLSFGFIANALSAKFQEKFGHKI